MIDWFFATLRQYPEIAIFLTLAHRLLLWQVHLQGHRPGVGHRHPAGRRPDRTDRDHDRAAAQGDGLPHVPVRRRLRRRAAVRARRRQGRPAAGALRGGPVRVLPARPGRDREDRRLRPRLRGRPLLGVADDLRRDGPLDRRHQPAGPARRSGQGPARLDADRLRGDLHVRHHGLGDRDRRPRPEAARHQSRRRLQGLRGEVRRRHQGAGRGRLGLAPLGSAGVPRQRRAGRRVGPRGADRRPRRWCPDARVFVLRIRRNGTIEEATADTVLHEGDVVAVAGARDVLRDGARGERDRGRGPGAAGRAGRGRRRPT